jgi:hypothetical protein
MYDNVSVWRRAIDVIICTDGTGYWSNKERPVRVTRIELVECEGNKFGELCATFDTNTWSTEQDGLIYTDKGWIDVFRAMLVGMGFSEEETMHICYSEQGMQGNNYVSMDAKEPFIQAWHRLM